MVTRAGTAAVVAVDVGGTRIKAAVVSQAGISGRELMRPTPTGDGPDAVVTELVSVITELIADPAGAEIAAVGVVVPGVVERRVGGCGGAPISRPKRPSRTARRGAARLGGRRRARPRPLACSRLV